MSTPHPRPEQSRPGRPGWYWDPWELSYNLAVRERWQREVVPRGPAAYRLRRWDGRVWTPETLQDYTLRDRPALPHAFGPTTRIHPLTPSDASRNLKIWAALMVLCSLGLAVTLVWR